MFTEPQTLKRKAKGPLTNGREKRVPQTDARTLRGSGTTEKRDGRRRIEYLDSPGIAKGKTNTRGTPTTRRRMDITAQDDEEKEEEIAQRPRALETRSLRVIERPDIILSEDSEEEEAEVDPGVASDKCFGGKLSLADGQTQRSTPQDFDVAMYEQAKASVKEVTVKPNVYDNPKPFETLRFGKFKINTWYAAPYPEEYTQFKTLYLCEYCLSYAKNHGQWTRHCVFISVKYDHTHD